MNAIRLYVDEDASEHAVVRALRARGVDLLTTEEAANPGSPDEQQLEFAAEQGRCLYTFNVGDFARLHRAWLEQGRSHPGIIVIPDQRCSIGDKIRRVAKLVASRDADDMRDRMEYL